jgi:1-acyl-sn-glycerol-3-phosphate acyltransferase
MAQRSGVQGVQAVPAYSPRLHRAFAWYLEGYLARHFSGVRVVRGGAPPQRVDREVALVVYSNHASWWDPALFMWLSRAFFPERSGHGPMDSAALERYRFFRRLGVFGVEPGTARGARTFLRVAREVLARPASALWLTAEGEFTDPRHRPVRLRAGLAHLARHLAADGVEALALPLALEYPFWNERLPEALLRFGEPIPIVAGSSRPAGEWQGVFERGLEATMDALAVAAQSRDAGSFDTLLAGRTGVGGVYDRWRSFRAALRGRRFDAAHGTGT